MNRDPCKKLSQYLQNPKWYRCYRSVGHQPTLFPWGWLWRDWPLMWSHDRFGAWWHPEELSAMLSHGVGWLFHRLCLEHHLWYVIRKNNRKKTKRIWFLVYFFQIFRVKLDKFQNRVWDLIFSFDFFDKAGNKCSAANPTHTLFWNTFTNYASNWNSNSNITYWTNTIFFLRIFWTPTGWQGLLQSQRGAFRYAKPNEC